MKELLELMAKALVDSSEGVEVTEAPDGGDAVRLELKVAPGDIGKVIGKQGRTAKALRTIVAAAGAKGGKRVLLEIIE
ncbi:MAG TPA: KH domain-containing protein [Candidatus Sulfotelmatobacter sp.]|jgi:predicted RNA-binding protein YlqC (UPF0109 family)|nr:KH domain-containing protein [Candidatus Sulfotelmatobacter sp.]